MVNNRFIHNIKNKDFIINTGIIASQPEYRKKSIGSISLYIEDKDSCIQRQINVINSTIKNNDTFLITGFDSKRVVDNIQNLRILENLNFETTNIAEDIRLLINASLGDNILLIMGNVIPSKTSLSSIDIRKSCVITSKKPGTDISVIHNDDNIVRFNYEKSIKDKWAGICYFVGEEYHILKDICSEKNSKKVIIEVLNQMIDAGCNIKSIQDNKVKII